MKWKAASAIAIIPLAVTALATPASAGADVSRDRFDEGHITYRSLPTGMCLTSHEQSDWLVPPDWDPGQSDAGGNFTDFYVGGRDDPGRLEFGLVTPSGQFSGQSHSRTCHE